MFYYLYTVFVEQFTFLNVFQYLTFRAGGALLTALLICFVIGAPIIRKLKSLQKEGQPIRDLRDCGLDTHVAKTGTPTMGGVMMLISLLISTLLWANLANPYIWIVLLVTAGFGALGFIDDYMKLRRRTHDGISSKQKLLGQTIISIIACLAIMKLAPDSHDTHLTIPFFKDVLLNLSYFYIPFVLVVLVGASNAVNLTDGLDGLAIVPVMIATACFGTIAYLAGNVIFADYLHIINVKGSGELLIICTAVCGAGLGFLWFNAPPAQVFMGDTGSLSFGGMLGTISVITKHEYALAIIGGLFVIETLSVIIQVQYFKRTGKRVFLMAPIHHHYEKKGWSEPKIVIRFWIIAIIFAIIGMATLKLR